MPARKDAGRFYLPMQNIVHFLPNKRQFNNILCIILQLPYTPHWVKLVRGVCLFVCIYYFIFFQKEISAPEKRKSLHVLIRLVPGGSEIAATTGNYPKHLHLHKKTYLNTASGFTAEIMTGEQAVRIPREKFFLQSQHVVLGTFAWDKSLVQVVF